MLNSIFAAFAALALTTSVNAETTLPIREMPVGLYPAAAVVTGLDYEADIVTVEKGNGMIYEFYGTEDYAEGDVVSMIMWDNGTTDDVSDDWVVDARYSGFWMY